MRHSYLLIVTPHDILACLGIVEQFGTLDEPSVSQLGRGDTILNDLALKLPVDEVDRRVEVHVWCPGRRRSCRTVLATHVPDVTHTDEARSVSLYGASRVGGHRALSVLDGDPLLGAVGHPAIGVRLACHDKDRYALTGACGNAGPQSQRYDPLFHRSVFFVRLGKMLAMSHWDNYLLSQYLISLFSSFLVTCTTAPCFCSEKLVRVMGHPGSSK